MMSRGDVYLFGPFRLDVGERVLLRQGEQVVMTPKAFDMLCFLISNSGRLVEKGKLLDELWPGAFVEEKTLSQHIFMIRKALGPDGAAYIKTVPKCGYRFIADVRVLPRVGSNVVVESHAPAASGAEGEFEADRGSAARGERPRNLAARLSDGGPAVSRPGPSAGRAAAAADFAPRPETFARRVSSRRLLKVGAAAFGLALAAGALALKATRTAVDANPNRPFQNFDFVKLATVGDIGAVGLSPDGKYVAYASAARGRERLLVQQIGSSSSVEVVSPAEVTYVGVTFSNDGASLFYVAREKDSPLGVLYQVPTFGGTPRKLIEDVDSPVTISPDGQRLAFIRNYLDSQENALMVAAVSGAEERKLATRSLLEGFSDEGPSWSPDGKLIACAQQYQLSWRGYSELLFVSTEDGSVTSLRLSGWKGAEQVAWLSDGRGIILAGRGPEAQLLVSQLWHLTYPGGEARRVTSDPNSYKGVNVSRDSRVALMVHSERVSSLWVAPLEKLSAATKISDVRDLNSQWLGVVWTPDGKLLYGSRASGGAEVWSMDSNGAGKRQLTSEPGSDLAPSVSPDGRFVVFTSFRTGEPHVWRMRSDGSDPTQLTYGQRDSFPVVSPDGKWVIYVSDFEDRPNLWKVPLEGGEAVRLTTGYFAISPAISPDGKTVACYFTESATAPPRLSIFSLEIPKLLKQFEVYLTDMPVVHWAPDGRAVAYVRKNGGGSNVWLQPVAGGPPKRLTNFQDDQLFRFDISQDGRLVFERGATIKDAVLISSK
ncbi:MAG TPA: winged helix-turn-helix domain-containing protein [Pyrinomonadaceae bacterium]|jgi:Tol biopolymer transport system component/DNA-binding winged helix-turn-helix (wHTH) protein